MKQSKLTLPASMTAALAFIITCGLSCTQKSTPPQGNQPLPPPEPLPAAKVIPPNPPLSTNNLTVTNVAPKTPPAKSSAPAITNPPPAATTPAKASTPALPNNIVVVEMPASPPTAPAKFYSDEPPLKSCCADEAKPHNYYLSFRAGYQHIYYHDNRDTYYVGAKFYANGAGLRELAGKNAWLVPDASAEISHQYLPKPDGSVTPGTGEGMQFRADFYWPWLNWTTHVLTRTNPVCPLCRPLVLGFGPVAEVGFDQLFDGSSARFARYAGARLTINHNGFIEYTAGGTDGLSGTRQQVVAELPIYASRDGEVRYVLRGEWNRADEAQPDVLSGGLFLEMPFSIFAEPKKWSDLVPFRGK